MEDPKFRADSEYWQEPLTDDEKSLTKLPPSVFKFFSLNERVDKDSGGSAKAYTLSTIRDSSIHFSAPIDFNDPYDCGLPFDPGTEEQRRAFISRIGGVVNPEMINRMETPEWRTTILNAVRREMKVSSFSDASDEEALQLMWGHYADGHRGLCLEFSTSSKLFASMHRVNYEKVPYRFQFFTEDRDERNKLALYKSEAWAYESELRAIMDTWKPDNIPFRANDLKSVTLGCAASPENKKEVAELLKEIKSPALVFEAIQLVDEYRLDKKPYTI